MGRKERDVEIDFFSSHQLACFFRAFPSFLDFFQAYLTTIVWKIMCLSEITRRPKYPFKPGSVFNMRNSGHSVGYINESKEVMGNCRKLKEKHLKGEALNMKLF